MRDIAYSYDERFQGQRDFIAFDQRGAGYSEPNLDCPELATLFYESLSQDLRLGLAEWEAPHLNACYDELAARGVNLAAYTSAADIDDLRVALGYEQINLYGGSYGARLALTAMRDLPEGIIRSVILDAPDPPQVDLYAARARNAHAALQAIFEACASDQACNSAYPDLESAFFDLITQLDANPLTIEALNSVSGQQQEVVVNANRVIETFYRANYSANWLTQFPSMICEMRAGEFDRFAQAMQPLLRIAHGISLGDYYAVQCSIEQNIYPQNMQALSRFSPDSSPIIQTSSRRRMACTRQKETMMNKRIFWNTLLALLVVGILASGGYALYRAGHRQGYREGLAENVDDERLSAFIEQGCDVERWSRNLGWGETHFRAGPGWGGPGKPARLAFLGLMLLLLLLVARAAKSRCSRAAGGRGWQLSFGPRPPIDNAPENATDE